MAWYNSVSIKKITVFLFLFLLLTPSRPYAHILPGFCPHSLLGTGRSPRDSPFTMPPSPAFSLRSRSQNLSHLSPAFLRQHPNSRESLTLGEGGGPFCWLLWPLLAHRSQGWRKGTIGERAHATRSKVLHFHQEPRAGIGTGLVW